MRIGRGRRSDDSPEFASFFAEDEGVFLLAPINVGASKGGRPLQLKVGSEPSLDFEWLLGFDVQQNDGSSFVDGHAKRLAHTKRIANVKNRSRLGADR